MSKTLLSADPRVGTADRDQVHVNLLGLGSPLREHAARYRVSVACAVRIAISRMLEDEAGERDSDADRSPALEVDTDQDSKTRVLLRVSPARAEALVTRARACGVSRSHYVEMLMDGGQPVALPAEHAAMITALMTSTDLLAALSLDLRVFMRLLGSVPAPELDPYRTRLRSLIDDVRGHLRLAASLLAELESTRRWR